MDYYKRALELNDETIKNRRYFHMNAEAGLHMPMACVYVMDKLTEYGLVPSRCGEGVTATVGNGGNTFSAPQINRIWIGAFEVRRRCDCYCRKWR